MACVAALGLAASPLPPSVLVARATRKGLCYPTRKSSRWLYSCTCQALKLCLARFLPFAKYRILKLTRFIDCLHVSVFEKPDISPQTKYSADFAFFCDTLFCDSINDGLVLPYFGFDFLKLLSRWEASLCLVQPQNSFIYLT